MEAFQQEIRDAMKQLELEGRQNRQEIDSLKEENSSLKQQVELCLKEMTEMRKAVKTLQDGDAKTNEGVLDLTKKFRLFHKEVSEFRSETMSNVDGWFRHDWTELEEPAGPVEKTPDQLKREFRDKCHSLACRDSPIHLPKKAETKIDNYESDTDRGTCAPFMNWTTGDYEIPAKGRYRFWIHHGRIEHSDRKNGRQGVSFFLNNKKGGLKKLEWSLPGSDGWHMYSPVDWDCEEGDKVSVQASVEGDRKEEVVLTGITFTSELLFLDGEED